MQQRQTQTTNELIKQQIDKLHSRNSGDWQTLIRQVDTNYRQINYNLSQMLTLFIAEQMKTVKNIDLEWSRGTGKTTLLSTFATRIARDMPRGVFQWEVPTYQKFLTEIIPAFIHGLEMNGMYKDLHYFIGRRPPAKWNWDEPYKSPARYDNFIIFYTGFGINLLSQDIAGAGRGLSTDGRLTSETTMLNKKKLDEESGPSIRGSNVRALGHKRFFDFRIMESSTPLTQEGGWFIERENLAIENPDKHRFLRANCVENIKLGFLKEDYLEVAKRESSDIETFNAEYLNIRPKLHRGSFYALLSQDRHGYTNYNYSHYQPGLIGVKADCRGDGDLVAGVPLMVCMDFGAAINSLVVCQRLPGELRVLKNFWVKGAEGMTQDDVIIKFNDYYHYHECKDIDLFHDASGNASTGNTKINRGQQALSRLVQFGWKVNRMSLGGTNPRHSEKFALWEKILEEKHPRLPKFRINMHNAKETFISMARAKAKRGERGDIKKGKEAERADNPNRELATDLSDALDYGAFIVYNPLSVDYGPALPG
jgi:hypothetical protein